MAIDLSTRVVAELQASAGCLDDHLRRTEFREKVESIRDHMRRSEEELKQAKYKVGHLKGWFLANFHMTADDLRELVEAREELSDEERELAWVAEQKAQRGADDTSNEQLDSSNIQP